MRESASRSPVVSALSLCCVCYERGTIDRSVSTVYRRWHKIAHPLDRFSEPSYSAPNTIPIPNDTFPESCRQDLPSGALFEAGALRAVEYLSFENRSKGVTLCHIPYRAFIAERLAPRLCCVYLGGSPLLPLLLVMLA